jgi:hypothetical protein
MDSKKLFHVLVVGGAILGGASGCGDELKPATVLPQDTADAGTTPRNDGGTGNDGGTEDDDGTGGGVEGW